MIDSKELKQIIQKMYRYFQRNECMNVIFLSLNGRKHKKTFLRHQSFLTSLRQVSRKKKFFDFLPGKSNWRTVIH